LFTAVSFVLLLLLLACVVVTVVVVVVVGASVNVLPLPAATIMFVTLLLVTMIDTVTPVSIDGVALFVVTIDIDGGAGGSPTDCAMIVVCSRRVFVFHHSTHKVSKLR
jgi:hypothetical protein